MILFVGDKPSPKMKPGAKPFEGAACEKRLKEWIEILTRVEGDEYLLGYSLDTSWRHKIVNSNRSRELREGLLDVKWYKGSIIALGNNASKALRSIPHFKLPHPSGRNRQINDKAFIAKKLAECKEWLNGV